MNRVGKFLILASLAVFSQLAQAHESRPAYLEINETASGVYDVLWCTPLNAGMRLPVILKLPDGADNVIEPAVRELPDSLVERRIIKGAGGLAGKRIDFVGLQGTITDVLVRVRLLDGIESTTVVRPSQAWMEVVATPGRWSTSGSYILHGIQHIAFGVNHLLFVLGLLLIVKDRWMLVKTVTAFTVAHSITLASATLGYASPSVAPLNAALALSILFLGPEIVKSQHSETSFTIRHTWVIAFAFGLNHGFGFEGTMMSAGLPRGDLPLALLGFNIGVEIGQVSFIALIVLLERSFRQLEIRWPRFVEALPGYAVGSLGAFWTFERTAILWG